MGSVPSRHSSRVESSGGGSSSSRSSRFSSLLSRKQDSKTHSNGTSDGQAKVAGSGGGSADKNGKAEGEGPARNASQSETARSGSSDDRRDARRKETEASDDDDDDSEERPPTSPRQLGQQQMPVTVPCQYRTGRTLGSGTYAIVKEAIHIKTGEYYACKVINKKLMEGREHMVRNEIAVLKRVSSGHRNIVTLHDYFETAHNLYLCFDLCTGGELFDRICAKGNYYEADAAKLVRIIFKAVKYIHDSGIVHRDLKPENLLFRDPSEEADIMVADFGLSRVMEEEKLNMLTEICGTPGYMAPEIFKKTGHGKPVDIWAMGVITYFLLAGYTPFDRDTQQLEMEAIIAGDYKFEPHEYWEGVSETAKAFVRYCLTIDPLKRPTAGEALQHPWLAVPEAHFVKGQDGQPTDLLPNVKKASSAKQRWRKAAFSITAVNRMQLLAGVAVTEAQKIKDDIRKYQAESMQEDFENVTITHHHNLEALPEAEEPKKSEDSFTSKFARAKLDDEK
ncbi:hypothetical protein AX16_006378 [Volvariella volvacea WC 439]|nr:hypothetical protein AX16_006378 [Volvariella volvacea WC 439]